MIIHYLTLHLLQPLHHHCALYMYSGPDLVYSFVSLSLIVVQK